MKNTGVAVTMVRRAMRTTLERRIARLLLEYCRETIELIVVGKCDILKGEEQDLWRLKLVCYQEVKDYL